MVRKLLLLFLSITCAQFAGTEELFDEPDQKIVLQTRKYLFEKYPGAFNPSIFKFEDHFLLTFRYTPDEQNQNWVSFIGIVELDQSLYPIGDPQLLNTRPRRSKTPSQAEDARIFSFRGKLFVIYNDNVDEIFFDHGKRRDMFIAELTKTENGFQLSNSLKLYHQENYAKFLHQKNWVPFEWNKILHLSYSLNPHEVVEANLKTGACHTVAKTSPVFNWVYGSPRGSTPPVLIDGEYLAFFHSGIKTKSPASYNWKLWHYFMGAYTFAPDSPFQITSITEKPILHEDFYTPSYREKRVVFPGGFVESGPHLHVAYGKDDCEIWIATLDKAELKKALKPITHP